MPSAVPIPFINSVLIPSLRQSCRMALVSLVISAMAWSAGLGDVCAALIFLIVKLGAKQKSGPPLPCVRRARERSRFEMPRRA
jgi:ABC-type proline/glycine betaine transport system permease subunit